MTDFSKIFSASKSIIGMLHLNGATPEDTLSTAIKESKILADAGFDGIIVENYFGSVPDVQRALDALCTLDLGLKIGVNVLGDAGKAFQFARDYPIAFVQLDSVCGHLPLDQDLQLEQALRDVRAQQAALLLGGVRFKYQPVRSTRTEVEDVIIGATRADALVVTSDATGQETDADKIARFRAAAPPSFPLIVGAGLTAQNVSRQMRDAQGGIVGSWLKTGHSDQGAMEPEHVKTFMRAFKQVREERA